MKRPGKIDVTSEIDKLIIRNSKNKTLVNSLERIKNGISEDFYEKEEVWKVISTTASQLMQYAGSKFGKRIKQNDDDFFNVLITAVNFLGEELAYSTITTGYLQDIFDAIGEIVIVVDDMGNLLYLNKTAKIKLDVRNEELKKISLFELAKGITNLRTLKRKSLNNKPVVFQTMTGKHIDTVVKITNFKREDNPMAGHVIVGHDITTLLKQKQEIINKSNEILKINKELVLREERLKKTIESSPVPMAIFDKEGKITILNRRFSEIFGYVLSEIPTISKLMQKAYPDIRYRKKIQNQWKKDFVLAKKTNSASKVREIIICDKNGEQKIVEFTAYPEKNEIIAIFHDITLKKQAEHEIREINAQLEKRVAEKTKELMEKNLQLMNELSIREEVIEKEKQLYEEKSRFVSVVSHEFINPLAGLKLVVQMIERYGNSWTDQKKQKAFSEIYDYTKYLNKIITEISEINKLDNFETELKQETIEVKSFCYSAIETIKDVFGKDITISFSCTPHDLTIKTDQNLLRHIFYNLLSNAVKYSPPFSTVLFDVKKTKNNTVWRVNDKGLGIPANEQEKAFELFYRATNVGKTKGSGLGLTIVRKCLEMLNGKIIIDSKKNCGTTIEIYLPEILENH